MKRAVKDGNTKDSFTKALLFDAAKMKQFFETDFLLFAFMLADFTQQHGSTSFPTTCFIFSPMSSFANLLFCFAGGQMQLHFPLYTPPSSHWHRRQSRSKSSLIKKSRHILSVDVSVFLFFGRRFCRIGFDIPNDKPEGRTFAQFAVDAIMVVVQFQDCLDNG